MDGNISNRVGGSRGGVEKGFCFCESWKQGAQGAPWGLSAVEGF